MESGGAAASVESTNSGEGILFICSRNCLFHGAGCGGAREEVDDMALETATKRDNEAMAAALFSIRMERIVGRFQYEILYEKEKLNAQVSFPATKSLDIEYDEAGREKSWDRKRSALDSPPRV